MNNFRWGHSGYKELYPEEFGEDKTPKKRQLSASFMEENGELKTKKIDLELPKKEKGELKTKHIDLELLPKKENASESRKRHKKSRTQGDSTPKIAQSRLKHDISPKRDAEKVKSSKCDGYSKKGSEFSDRLKTHDLKSEKCQPKTADTSKVKAKSPLTTEKCCKDSSEKRKKEPSVDDKKIDTENIGKKVKTIHEPSGSDDDESLLSRAAEIREQIKKLSHTVDERKSKRNSMKTTSNDKSGDSVEESPENQLISLSSDSARKKEKHAKSKKHKKRRTARDGSDEEPLFETSPKKVANDKNSSEKKNVLYGERNDQDKTKERIESSKKKSRRLEQSNELMVEKIKNDRKADKYSSKRDQISKSKHESNADDLHSGNRPCEQESYIDDKTSDLKSKAKVKSEKSDKRTRSKETCDESTEHSQKMRSVSDEKIDKHSKLETLDDKHRKSHNEKEKVVKTEAITNLEVDSRHEKRSKATEMKHIKSNEKKENKSDRHFHKKVDDSKTHRTDSTSDAKLKKDNPKNYEEPIKHKKSKHSSSSPKKVVMSNLAVNGSLMAPVALENEDNIENKAGYSRLKFKTGAKRKFHSPTPDDQAKSLSPKNSPPKHNTSNEKSVSLNLKRPIGSSVLDDVKDPMEDFPDSHSEVDSVSEGELVSPKEKKYRKKSKKKKDKKKKKKDKHSFKPKKTSAEFSLEVSDNFGLCDSVLAFDSLGDIE